MDIGLKVPGFRHDAGRVGEIATAAIGRWLPASTAGEQVTVHDAGELTEEQLGALKAALEAAAKEEPVDSTAARRTRRQELIAAIRNAGTVAQVREAVAAALEEVLG